MAQSCFCSVTYIWALIINRVPVSNIHCRHLRFLSTIILFILFPDYTTFCLFCLSVYSHWPLVGEQRLN